MTKAEKRDVISKPAVAYFSGYGGVEIKSIEYGINDAVLFVAGAWCSDRSAHRSTVYYTVGDACRPYFRYRGNRIYLDDCIRV